MEKLVPILNQLQSVLGILGTNSISLPQLVVVGSQSAGKSSVLENIVGRDFLPRGNNIVTRRPLVLQLHNTSFNTDSSTFVDYGEFEHQKGKKYTDFSLIKQEINDETTRLLGVGSNISTEPIYLSIYSTRVPTLTLVDLPGIVKVPTGDQPEDIERLTKKMILHFISNPNAIIVAVSSSTEDIANSEALKLAKEVDPAGKRTLSVLTKLDLMDQGTDALRILRNEIIPLQLGHMGVINRSQLDINSNKSITDALASEEKYFMNSVYRGCENVGTKALTQRLSNLLLNSLQQHLPTIREQIIATIAETEKELKSYGNPFGLDEIKYQELLSQFNTIQGTDSENLNITEVPEELKGSIVLGILNRFSTSYKNLLEGRGELDVNEIYGGARISEVFNTVFSAKINAIDPFDYLTDDEIHTTICNARGTKALLFIPEVAFELLVGKQIERFRHPSCDCVDYVHKELIRIVQQCIAHDVSAISQYPNLRRGIIRILEEELTKRLKPTKNMVEHLINMELAYINLHHPDFIDVTKALNQIHAKKAHAAKNNPNGSSSSSSSSGSGSNSGSSSSGNNTLVGSNASQVNHRELLHADATETQKKQAQSIAANHGVQFKHPLGTDNTSPHTMYGTGSNSRGRKPLGERELMEIEATKVVIASYFNIVKKTIKDLVPKTIMYMLVNHSVQEVHSILVRELYKRDKFDELLVESHDIGEKRESCVKLLSIMKSALKITNRLKSVQL